LVIVFASLQPFAGWRAPPEAVLGYLTAPWPRYPTAGDALLNVLAYLPLGAMLFAALRPPLSPAVAFITATVIAATLSLALESVQMFLPTRIASNVDLLANGTGGLLGALAAWVFALPALAGNPFIVLRRSFIRTGALGDCGLIVIALWLLIQCHPAPLALGGGDMREALRLAPLFEHTPQSYLIIDAAVAAFATAAIGVLVTLLLQPGRSAVPALALTFALAFAVKSIAALTLARSAHWLQWLTPGMATGFAIGITLLASLLQFPRARRTAGAALCIVAGIIIVNTAPENPYQATPAFMLSPQPTHLLNFGNIVRVLSQAWPFGALMILLAFSRAPAAPDDRGAL
jgi:VanZ family protein